MKKNFVKKAVAAFMAVALVAAPATVGTFADVVDKGTGFNVDKKIIIDGSFDDWKNLGTENLDFEKNPQYRNKVCAVTSGESESMYAYIQWRHGKQADIILKLTVPGRAPLNIYPVMTKIVTNAGMDRKPVNDDGRVHFNQTKGSYTNDYYAEVPQGTPGAVAVYGYKKDNKGKIVQDFICWGVKVGSGAYLRRDVDPNLNWNLNNQNWFPGANYTDEFEFFLDKNALATVEGINLENLKTVNVWIEGVGDVIYQGTSSGAILGIGLSLGVCGATILSRRRKLSAANGAKDSNE